MKGKMLLLGFIILLLPIANAQLEKPNWSTGDYWNYSGTYAGTATIDLGNESSLTTTIDAAITMEMKVKDVEIKEIDGEYIGCYLMEMTGRIKGTYKYEFGDKKIEGDFDVHASGNVYFSTQNLSVVESDVTTNISITPSLPGTVPPVLQTTTTYNPPLDFMNFPVEVNEKWTASSMLTTTMGGQSSSDTLTFSFKCTDRIPEQGGHKYVIQADYVPFIGDLIPLNNTLIFWSESKGMIESIRDRGGGSQTLQIAVTDWKYEEKENLPPTASFSFSPLNPEEGKLITFDGSSSTDDEGIAFYFWNFGDNTNATGSTVQHAYGKEGTYTVTLTVMDSYGSIDIEKKTITIKGTGGGSTPGFESIAIFISIAVLIMMRKRLNSGNFK